MTVPEDQDAPRATASGAHESTVDAIPVSSDIPVNPDVPITPVEVYDVTVMPPADTAAGAANGTPGGAASAAPDGTVPRKRKGLKWLWVTLVSLLVAGLIALSVYMIVITNNWQEYSEELEVAVEDLRAVAAEDRAATEATQARLDTVQSQLDTANQRITDLANEEANAIDTRDILRNYMDAMISCADGRQELIRALKDSSLYYPGKTKQQVENELTEYCNSVKNDYNDYLAE